jgi:uncharacterized RDD family membrane protein YckC
VDDQRPDGPGSPPPRGSPPRFPSPAPSPPDPFGSPASFGQGLSRSGPRDVLGRPLATWGQRVAALLIDTLVISMPGAMFLWIVAATTSTSLTDPFTGGTHRYVPAPFNFASAVVLAAEVIYFATLDGQSQTVGKRVLGIAVRSRATGSTIGFGRALGRWLIYVGLFYLFVIPGILNVLSPLWDGKRQAWHDRAVGSVVVSVR